MRKSVCLIALSCVVFTTCKKEKDEPGETAELITTEVQNGLPQYPTQINGYMYADFVSNGNGTDQGRYQGFAGFGDPARNVMSNYNHYTDQMRFSQSFENQVNVQVGNVYFNNRILSRNQGGSVNYNLFSDGISFFDKSATWTADGNKSFVAFNRSVPRGFPLVADAPNTSTVSISAGYEVDLSASRIQNYDSVSVVIGHQFGTNVRKTVAAGKSVVFTTSELQQQGTSYVQTSIKAFNYSHFTVQNKTYVVELAKESAWLIQLVP
jgi:hypothetical protein